MICPHPVSIPRPNGRGAQDRIQIPCGKCAFCLKSRREEWITRLMEEAKHHDSMIFVTLTYDDSKIYKNEKLIPSVNKEHVQLYLKRIRKKNR